MSDTAIVTMSDEQIQQYVRLARHLASIVQVATQGSNNSMAVTHVVARALADAIDEHLGGVAEPGYEASVEDAIQRTKAAILKSIEDDSNANELGAWMRSATQKPGVA